MAKVTKQDKTIESVLKNGLCTGCGTCAGLCPQNAIQMLAEHHQGIYLPRIDNRLCDLCGLCFQICPGHAVDFSSLSREILGHSLLYTPLGNHRNCYVGYATNYDIRYNAASGGLVTALLISALEKQLIDGVLVTKMREDRPLEPQPFIARNKVDIISAAKSKYCPVPANVALREIMETDGRYAIVGLPCHIQGVRKASSIIKKLKKRVVLCLSLVCGHCDTFQGTKFLVRTYCKGRDIKDITHLDYRGQGWPGFLAITFKNNTVISIPYDEYMIFHGLWFFAHKRCILCCDSVSKLSDITIMDAWLPEIKVKDTMGTSFLIARTVMGEELCNYSFFKRTISIESALSTDLIRSQGKERFLNGDLPIFLTLRRVFGRREPNYNLSLPHAKPINYMRALLIYLNVWILSRPLINIFLHPISRIEGAIFRIVD